MGMTLNEFFISRRVNDLTTLFQQYMLVAESEGEFRYFEHKVNTLMDMTLEELMTENLNYIQEDELAEIMKGDTLEYIEELSLEKEMSI